MSSPLSLRLWCLAAMAPALTEATPQARVKQQTVVPGIPSTQVPLVNGRNTQVLTSESMQLKVPLDGSITSRNLATFPRDSSQNTHSSRTIPGSNLGPLQGRLNSSSSFTTKDRLVSETQSLLGKVGAQGMNCSAAGDAALKQNGNTRPVTGIQLNGSTVRASSSTMGFKIPPQKPPAFPVPMGSTVEESPLHIQEVGDSLLAEGSQLVSSGMADVGVLRNVDLVAETSQRQHEIDRRLDRLMRRLRRLQSQLTVKHTKDQLSMFVDYQHSNLQSIAHSMKSPPAGVDLKSGVLQKEDAKNLSTAALVTLVRKLQSSQASLRQRLSEQNASQPPPVSVLKLNQDHCREMQCVSGTLLMNLHHLESAVDSDATESSSGGESCDEDYDYDVEKISRPPLTRRCEWRFGSERSAVAARWTWLQAQVSDLEYRIRQQTEIYRQIRAGKGAVVLGEAPPPHEHLARAARAGRKLTPLEEKIALLERKNMEMSPSNLSTLLSNVDKQSHRLTQQLGNVYSPQASPLVGQVPGKVAGTPNGLMDHSGLHPGNGTAPEGSDAEAEEERSQRPSGTGNLRSDPPSPVIDSSCTAARCQPVKSYGKRKLLRTAGLYQVSRKAARLSTVRCGCYPPVTPCTLCGGRYNNTQTVDTHWTPLPERVAILDPSFHSVLSFKEDVSLPLHFESLLKTGGWEHKPAPARLIKPLPTQPRRPPKRDVRRYNKRLQKNASAALISSKIKSKYEQKTLPRVMTTPNVTKMDANGLKRSAALRKNRRLFGAGSNRALSGRSLSSMSASCPSSTLREMKDTLRRRRGESAFDINNIVIPYSMAASTRVEKLKYKDIITPKWRELTRLELERLRAGLQNPPGDETPDVADALVTDAPLVDSPSPPAALATPPGAPAPHPAAPEIPSVVPATPIPTNSLPPGVKIVEDPEESPPCTAKTEDEETEDISEETYEERHMRCEVAERKRFSSVITKKRAGRGARSDSTASVTSAPTPTVEMASVEFEPAPSALQTPPDTPAPPDLPYCDDLSRRSGSVLSRLDEMMGPSLPRRSGSFSRQRQLSGSFSLCDILDEPEVSPWEKRTFPLCDSDLQQVALDNVEEEPVAVLRPPPPAPVVPAVAAVIAAVTEAATPGSGAVSPVPSSSSSDMINEEDPDDPEWTVVGSEPVPKPRPASGIFLKLAKR